MSKDYVVVLGGERWVVPAPVAERLRALEEENVQLERNERTYRALLEDKEEEIRRLHELEIRKSSAAPELLLDAVMEYGEHRGEGLREMTLPLYRRRFDDYHLIWKTNEDERRVTITARRKA